MTTNNTHTPTLSIYVFFLAFTFICSAMYWAFPSQQFEFNALAINNGEYYRIITAHFTHQNIWHLLLNIAGLFIVCMLFTTNIYPGWQYLFLPVILIVISLALWIVFDYSYYLGLSAYLHALFTFALVFDLHQKRPFSRILALGLVGKVALEMFSHDNRINSTIGIEVAVESHLVGCIVGAMIGIVFCYGKARRECTLRQ